MKKEKLVYIINLVIIVISYVLVISFNLGIFNINKPIDLFYGVGCIIMLLLSSYTLYLSKKKYELSLYRGRILGIIILIFLLVDSMLPYHIIIKNLRFINAVILFDSILISVNAHKNLNILNGKNSDSKNKKNNGHSVSHNSSRKREITKREYRYNEGEKNMDGTVVNGYISSVVFDDVVGVYCLEIEYDYEGEGYVFYYGNFDIDITPILDQKNLRKINVFLPGDNPEFAQIDEELLFHRINN